MTEGLKSVELNERQLAQLKEHEWLMGFGWGMLFVFSVLFVFAWFP